MATPVSNIPQQPQQQQPLQQLPQTHIHHVQPAVTYQTCCGPYPKILEGKSRSAAHGIGIAILLVGIVSFIVGIVGFFTNTYVYSYYNGHSYTYRYAINYTVYIGANIWCGIFVSGNSIK